MKKITKLLSLIIALCIGIAAFSGCELFFEESIDFSQSSIDMVYGESLDLDPYINIKNLERGVYTLSVSNDKVVEVVTQSGIKAVGTGETVVKATLTTGLSATVKIKVSFTDPTSLTIFESGELYQRADSSTRVIFTAVLSEGANPATTIDWLVDDEPQSTSGTQLTLPAKTKAGAYTVLARQSDNHSIFDEKTVRVYDNYTLPVFTYEGAEVYESPTTVSFGFDAKIEQGNPEYLYEMYINGQLHESTHDYSPTFSYTPSSAGIYTFSFTVNGETVLRGANDTKSPTAASSAGSSLANGINNIIGGTHNAICTNNTSASGFFAGDTNASSFFASSDTAADSVRICFKGVITPHGLELDFAGNYPSVILSWLNREETKFTLSLTPSGGKEQIVSGIAAENGFMDIAEFIDLTKSYTIKIKSETSGDYFLGSDYVSFTHTAISAAALHYLSASYLNGHFYMTEDSKVFDVFDYMLIFRPNAAVSADKIVSEVSVFMGYTSSMTAATFEKQFENRLTITGNYWWSVFGSASRGNILKIALTFHTKNQPENFSTSGKTKLDPLTTPMVTGGYSRQLPVDALPLSKSVATNTNELFYTLERGLKPVVQKDSAAERIYNKAREVLVGILDDTMDEAEMAGAIYDWIIFAQSYDTSVTTNDGGIDYAVLQPAYYPEGVFETGFAVCDGISKSFSLLCNMMGIKCVRVVGKAGSSKADHAWNKVLIGGQWYIVDATWGGGEAELNYGTYKTGTREYFLITDADVSETHFELGFLYPKTAATGYGWYVKNNRFLYSTQDLAGQISNLIDRIEDFYAEGKDSMILGQSYTFDFYAFELKISSELMREFRSIPNILTSALDARGFRNTGYEYINISNTTILIAFR